MPISYAVSKCRNPKNPDVDYFSCRDRKTSDYTFEDLASDIAFATTVTEADALAVLTSIRPFVKKALLNGRRVILNKLGSFHIGIQSKCFNAAAMDAENFLPSEHIKGHRVIFRPEANLKNEIATEIKFQRVSSEVMP